MSVVVCQMKRLSVCVCNQMPEAYLLDNAKHFHFTWSPDINVLCAIRKKQDQHALWTITTTNNHLSLKMILFCRIIRINLDFTMIIKAM